MQEDESFAEGEMTSSASTSSSSSLKTTCVDKIKLRCSHGGKIMVQKPDGHLKYIGGETRIVAISRHITFSELMKKLSGLVNGGGDFVLKYQLVPEELDILVTVRSDEDLKHMMDEYNRQERDCGRIRTRAFLFPSKPAVVASSGYRLSSYERYIDAVNGVVRVSPPSLQLRTAPSSTRPSFSISSPCSPKEISPDKILNPWDASNLLSHKRSLSSMPRVKSSPTLFTDGGGVSHQQNGYRSQFGHQIGMYQGYRHQNQVHGHHYHQHHGGGHYSVNSLQPRDFYRNVGNGATDRFNPAGGNPKYKDCRGPFDEGCNTIDRTDSIPHTRSRR